LPAAAEGSVAGIVGAPWPVLRLRSRTCSATMVALGVRPTAAM
jgi:hypothetical protein